VGRWLRALFIGLVGLALLAACTNVPPPPLVSTPDPSTTPNRQVNKGEVVVGVDSMAGGFNPHKLADQSAVTTALANLLLPSVFRPAPDGTPQLDTTLMVSAEVTRAEPYTVTYQIRPEASWADNAPIAAEDFVFLWQQLRNATDAIDGAGYRLIANITARDTGKTVEVTFAKPYPGWRSLWSGLVPAHLLKDAPGGWASALHDSFPTTGGPFSIKTLDRDRGEIVLERNDRYWEKPAAPDQIVLRRADQSGVIDALGAGHDQLSLSRLDAVGANRFRELPQPMTVYTVPRSTVVTLLLRPTGPDLSAQGVRLGIVALLNREPLITIGTGNGPADALPANAQVLAPSLPSYASTLPSTLSPGRPDPDQAARQLSDAGYTKTGGSWTRDGRPLSLVIAAPTEQPSYLSIANEIGRQLTAGGILTRVESLPASELITQLAAQQQNTPDQINLVVAPQPVGGDPATVLATNFGCVSKSDAAATTAAAPVSAIGSCDPAIQPTIDAALTGAVALPDALSTVEPAVWRQAVSIPLYQEAESLVIRPEMSGVSVGPPLAGPFAGAPGWRKSVN
jgi:ABC-type transport system substrate-binding protein